MQVANNAVSNVKYPISRPDLSGNEQKYALSAVNSSWISSTGEFVDQFEVRFAAFTATQYALGVTNGSSALHLALAGLGVGPGDEVLIPSLTHVATANAVLRVGATPVFVDVDSTTWCIDPEDLIKKISPRSRAVIAAHLYGHPADMDRIKEVASPHNLWIVEDTAQAHGALYKGRPVGGLGHVATFSFDGDKIITGGEGGALTTNDPELFNRLKLLRGQGMDPNRRYYFPVVGFNYRLTNIACAILCAQLERVDEILERRRSLGEQYDANMRCIHGVETQPISRDVTVAPWLCNILVDDVPGGLSTKDICSLLAANEIESQPFFTPVHQLPTYKDLPTATDSALPVTLELSRKGISLPLSPSLRPVDVDFICRTLAEAVSSMRP
jgi:perosamine synthetase